MVRKKMYDMANAMLCMRTENGYAMMSEINDDCFYDPSEFLDNELDIPSRFKENNLILVLDYCMRTENYIPINEQTLMSFKNPLCRLLSNFEERRDVYQVLKKESKQMFLTVFARDLLEESLERHMSVSITDNGNISFKKGKKAASSLEAPIESF